MAEKKTKADQAIAVPDAVLVPSETNVALDAAIAVFAQCWRGSVDPGAAACQAVALGVAFAEAWEARRDKA